MKDEITWAALGTTAWFAIGTGFGLVCLAFGEGSILTALLIGAVIGGINLLAETIDIVTASGRGPARQHGVHHQRTTSGSA